jgi:ethanolamine utilization microcompartment shell protein EutL
MQNQSSPAQLLFPIVPANYCPEGKWSDILNSFIQLYLNNGTVNIPFLNQVTPEQITALQQSVLTIQNQLNAVNYQVGTTTISASASAQKITITIPTAMANANYQITGYFTPTAGTSTAACSWGVVNGSATTTKFDIWVFNPAANTDILSFTWQVANLGAL